MLSDLLPRFKVVEINNVASLRMGHVIAQIPSTTTAAPVVVEATSSTYAMQVPTKVVGSYTFVENGVILGVDQTGRLVPYAADRHAQPVLHYTEELETAGLLSGLDQFAVQAVNAEKVYLRGLPLNVGDTFTTNNIDSCADGYAKVAPYSTTGAQAGTLVYQSAATADTLFKVTKTTLPAGQEAVECLYIGKAI